MANDFTAFARALGAAIKAARNKAKLTQEGVAFEAEVSVRHYQQLESGEMNLRLNTLYQVADVLGLKVSDLVRQAEKVAETHHRH